MNDYEDHVRTYMSASQESYADARDQTPGDRGWASLPHLAQMLTAHGHSSDKTAEIIQIAQQLWSKNLH
jgi:hypothetical protein